MEFLYCLDSLGLALLFDPLWILKHCSATYCHYYTSLALLFDPLWILKRGDDPPEAEHAGTCITIRSIVDTETEVKSSFFQTMAVLALLFDPLWILKLRIVRRHQLLGMACITIRSIVDTETDENLFYVQRNWDLHYYSIHCGY